MYKLIAILENNVKTINDIIMLVIVVTISMGDSIFCLSFLKEVGTGLRKKTPIFVSNRNRPDEFK